MDYNFCDLFAASAALTLAVVLAFVKMPGGEQWSALRRMNRLLIACYCALGISNIVTSVLGIGHTADPVLYVSMLVVSMYQAMLFTATCVAFVSPSTISREWLTTNTLVISCLGVMLIYSVCAGGAQVEIWLWGCTAAYVFQLIYYCVVFRANCYHCLHRLEGSYDDDMSGSLRLVTNAFFGALTVGLSALVFIVFRLDNIWYNVFTCIYIIYYAYLVICVINYRIGAGYILKVVAAKEDPAYATVPDESTDAEGKAGPTMDSLHNAIDPETEKQLAAALEKWVATKQYVRNDQTVEDIAAELGTTHATLKWYFTNCICIPFRTWRQDVRLNEAIRLLSEEDAPTSSVHTMVGVSDKSNFHKLFRKQVGMSLQEFKEKIRKSREQD